MTQVGMKKAIHANNLAHYAPKKQVNAGAGSALVWL
jgi:hypothetical protein